MIPTIKREHRVPFLDELATHQLPRSHVHTPNLRTAWPSSVGLQTYVRRYDDKDIAGSFGDAKATISAWELVQSLDNVTEWIHLVDRSTVERGAQYIAVGPDGEVFDPRLVWKCPERSDGVALGWIKRECHDGCDDGAKEEDDD